MLHFSYSQDFVTITQKEKKEKKNKKKYAGPYWSSLSSRFSASCSCLLDYTWAAVFVDSLEALPLLLALLLTSTYSCIHTHQLILTPLSILK